MPRVETIPSRRSRRLSEQAPRSYRDEFNGSDIGDLQYPESPFFEPSARSYSPASSILSDSQFQSLSATQTKRHSRKREATHVPRPPNAFILFRSSYWESQRANPEDRDHRQVSRKCGAIWNSLSASEQEPFKREAERRRIQHIRDNPNYKFTPKARLQSKKRKLHHAEAADAAQGILSFPPDNSISPPAPVQQSSLRVSPVALGVPSPMEELSYSSPLYLSAPSPTASSSSVEARLQSTSRWSTPFLSTSTSDSWSSHDSPVSPRTVPIYDQNDYSVPQFFGDEYAPAASLWNDFTPTSEIPVLDLDGPCPKEDQSVLDPQLNYDYTSHDVDVVPNSYNFIEPQFGFRFNYFDNTSFPEANSQLMGNITVEQGSFDYGFDMPMSESYKSEQFSIPTSDGTDMFHFINFS